MTNNRFGKLNAEYYPDKRKTAPKNNNEGSKPTLHPAEINWRGRGSKHPETKRMPGAIPRIKPARNY